MDVWRVRKNGGEGRVRKINTTDCRQIPKTARQNLLPETTPDFDKLNGIIGRKLVDGQKKKLF